MSRRPTYELSIDEERRIYFEGIRLFNAGEFFEAHETWEDAWYVAEGAKRYFYQGLIQVTVAFEHWRRGNPRGALSLYQTALTKFERLSPAQRRGFLGIDVDDLLRRFTRAMAPLLEADPDDRAAVAIEDYPDRLFKIAIDGDPFAADG
ncbi:MAG: hypothetical protein BIFFINMI_03555 [Phycisphaerae bacterium]|nr:hypothetical protein [Phycisphaerae bacterium]